MLFKVTNVTKETPNTVTIRCIGDTELSFLPGQFMMMTVSPDGEKVKRAYSIASSPTKEYIEFCVKEMPDGLVSKYLQTIPKGKGIELTGPYGQFILNEKSDYIALIAAGAGIAPFRSMIQYIVDKNLPMSVDLFFCNKTEKDIIYRKELEQFTKDRNIQLFISLTQSDKNWMGQKGRFTLTYFKENIKDLQKPLYYICGSTEFVQSMKESLISGGVKKKNIKIEMYG